MTNIIFDKSLHNDQNADGKLRVDVPVNKAPAQTGGVKIGYNISIWQKDLES